MKIDTMFRHIREAFKSIIRNGWMTFAAVSASGVTLLIFGFFLVFAFNISFMAGELDKQVSVRASLSATASADNIDQLKEQIQKDPMVADVEFVSKEDGLKMMKEQWGDDSEYLDGLEKDNPLPDTLVIKAVDPQKTPELKEKIKKFNFVDDADAGEGVTDRLLDLSSLVRNVVLLFGLGLAVLAAFLISNTIKLTIFARRREIEVMRLVGASNWFIRWPFFFEGGLIGILGSIIPVAVVLAVYSGIIRVLDADSAYGFFKLLPMSSISMWVAGVTILLGVIIGVWGSMISIRRFLKV
ncbi:permease-like cell division protein FtsX [Desmospora profundinema]|uniref:Cell division protein FtsX n=1 Tax=Desmospora profundinema TaxID=1571184 RepID=A0ABU1ILF1_9BACL|nr:permease-like cell division protein FtsX [Desmospora profundinema]MDR6225604.1 cell division transport system permease protein [Desmospora profundinema]